MKLSPSDTIGLIAPSGFIREGQLEQALRTVKLLGLKPYYTDRVFKREDYLAGSEQNRLDDLHHHFENKDVKAIWCIRGGFGATRLLPHINYNLIKNNHKIFMGYSDITALLYAFYKKSDLLSFHAPMAGELQTLYNINNLKEVLFDEQKKIEYTRSSINEYNCTYKYDIFNKGKSVIGKLIGGNLSLMISLIGTEYDIDYHNKIVFIEEIAEPFYKIDRMLTQLLQATNFSKAAAVVFGVFNKCEGDENSDSLQLHGLFQEKLKNMNVPIIAGFSFGHVQDNAVIPFGAIAKIDTRHHCEKYGGNIEIL